jgi:hypothetical protein
MLRDYSEWVRNLWLFCAWSICEIAMARAFVEARKQQDDPAYSAAFNGRRRD